MTTNAKKVTTMADINEGELFICPGVNGVLRKTGPVLGQPREKGAEPRVIYPDEPVRKFVPRKKGS